MKLVLRNPVRRAVLRRGAELGVPDWWPASGAVFQTVWNVLADRDPTAGVRDYDLIYFDPTGLAWQAEMCRVGVWPTRTLMSSSWCCATS